MKRLRSHLIWAAICFAIFLLFGYEVTVKEQWRQAVTERDHLIKILQAKETSQDHVAALTTQIAALQTELSTCQQDTANLHTLVAAAETEPAPTPTPHPTKNTNKAGKDDPVYWDACVVAKSLITQYIVKENGFAEKTIKFPWSDTCSKTTTKTGNNEYRYMGTVTYKNAYNAEMQSQVTAFVTTTDGTNYTLTRLKFY